MNVYYCGCYQQAGHYIWTRSVYSYNGKEDARYNHLSYSEQKENIPEYICQHWDAKWMPNASPKGMQGEAALAHVEGCTILSFQDRSVDARGGSHSTFIITEATLDFEEALELCRENYPEIFARFTFEVKELEKK